MGPVGSPYHVATTYPCGQPGSPSFATHWRFFATPTRRYHGRMLIHPSPLRVPPSGQGVCTHAGSGPSRVRRRLFLICLGDPISLAISPALNHSLRSHDHDLCHLVSACITKSTIELLGSCFRASLTLLVDSQHRTCLLHFSATDARALVCRVVELIKITDVAC